MLMSAVPSGISILPMSLAAYWPGYVRTIPPIGGLPELFAFYCATCHEIGLARFWRPHYRRRDRSALASREKRAES
jgi:hypothetical protein